MQTTPTLFTKAGCPYCEEGRQFLRSQGVEFFERNVSVDTIALKDLLFMLGRAEVPVLCAGYQAATGFDPGQWEVVLAHGRELGPHDPLGLPCSIGEDPMGD